MGWDQYTRDWGKNPQSLIVSLGRGRNHTFPSFAQAFDPYGNLIGGTGYVDTNYGYTGELSDSSGLVYLRARYYSPALGRFISRDPFPGVLSQPDTLNPYVYALNNPVRYTDPSGEFILQALAAAGIGGLNSAAFDIGAQLLHMRPISIEQAMRCWDWREVGISFAAGAVTTLEGFTVFGGITALFGTGFLVNVAGGAFAGIIAGQYGIIANLVLSGQADQLRGSMFRWQDIVLDGVLGGIGGAISYGLQRGLSGIAKRYPSKVNRLS